MVWFLTEISEASAKWYFPGLEGNRKWIIFVRPKITRHVDFMKLLKSVRDNTNFLCVITYQSKLTHFIAQ